MGKTALGREFGKELDQYIEINFDEHPSKNAYFDSVEKLTLKYVFTTLGGVIGFPA